MNAPMSNITVVLNTQAALQHILTFWLCLFVFFSPHIAYFLYLTYKMQTRTLNRASRLTEKEYEMQHLMKGR